ncbi:hypothetical protein Hanom_Chr10g00902581 [Helianthus anomalus]
MMPKKLKQVNQAYDVDEQFMLTVYTIKGGGGEELNQGNLASYEPQDAHEYFISMLDGIQGGQR